MSEPLTSAIAIKSEVKEKISSSTAEIRSRVVAQLAEQEIAKRTDLLTRALSKRDEQSKALDKIRPDQIAFSETGEKITETFSKAKVEELKKAKEQLTKIDKAIDKAILEANFDEVRKVCEQGNQGNQGNQPQSE